MGTASRLIAVVDDDEAVRQAIDGLLRSAGFPVSSFASAEAFLDSPQRCRTGCLILDLRMPGMGGLALQQRLVGNDHRIPTIVLTAHGGADVRERTLAAGAIAFLTKPFDADVLLTAVAAALKSR